MEENELECFSTSISFNSVLESPNRSSLQQMVPVRLPVTLKLGNRSTCFNQSHKDPQSYLIYSFQYRWPRDVIGLTTFFVRIIYTHTHTYICIYLSIIFLSIYLSYYPYLSIISNFSSVFAALLFNHELFFTVLFNSPQIRTSIVSLLLGLLFI